MFKNIFLQKVQNFQNMKSRGAFIVFEGIDRSGKSTQSSRLIQNLEKRGIPFMKTGFPQRSTPIGKEIDAYLKSTKEIEDEKLHDMFSQNRWEFRDAILTDLNSGKTIVSDRYAFSGVAYSVAKGMEVERCKKPDAGLPAPDLVIFLDALVQDVKKRSQYGEERYEKEEFQKKVRESFNKHMIKSDWLVIDALKSMDEIESQVLSAVLETIQKVATQPIQTLWS